MADSPALNRTRPIHLYLQDSAHSQFLLVALMLECSAKDLSIMIKNYFITAIRNLTREKSSAFLNIAGLTLGIACSLILFLLVKHQATFDRDHIKRDRIYRVVSQSEGNHGK
jgi:hypothetical protein